LTLPEPIASIKLKNAGTALHTDIAKISVFGDGDSAGWDGDEEELIIKSSSPFWDTWLSGDFSQTRIFVTVDIASTAVSERTIKPQLQVNSIEFVSEAISPTDEDILGFERMILAGASTPTVPVTPFAKTPEALSASTIRWHFTDMSNNEFGFKVLDENLQELVRKEESNLSYIDETGLQPDTEYSGRIIVAFNDRGESLISSLAVFPAVSTLIEEAEEEIIEEEVIEEEVEETIEGEAEVVEEVEEEEEVVEEPSLLEIIQQKIAELQQQIDELFNRLAETLEQQGATIWTAFQRFFQSLFGK